MHTKEKNIKEEAYAIDALEVSEQHKMDRKCMVVKMNVEDGTFSLREALNIYKVPVRNYLEYTVKKALSEVNSELSDSNKTSFVEMKREFSSAASDFYALIRQKDLNFIGLDYSKLPAYDIGWVAGQVEEPAHGVSHTVIKMPKLKSFFIDRLKDMWWTEKFMIKGLSELSEKVHNETLSSMLDNNVTIREVHVDKLTKVFEIFDRKATGKKSDAIHNFFGEASSFISNKKIGTTVQEAGVVYATQKILHYNIANYGSLATLAEKMGKPEAADILTEALKNEMATEKALTRFSENLADSDKTLGTLMH